MLIVFPIMLMLWFGLTQLALIAMGKFVLAHAAHRAARAAVVVLDDDPEKYGDGKGSRNAIDGDGDPKLSAIRSAAAAPLTVLGPSDQSLDFGKLVQGEMPISLTLREALTSGAGQALMGLVGYNAMSVALTLRQGDEVAESFGLHEPVTAHVDYLFPCRVPFAAQLLCRTYQEIVADKETRADLEKVESPDLQKTLSSAPWRFLVLSAEETLPNQGADYHGKYAKKEKNGS